MSSSQASPAGTRAQRPGPPTFAPPQLPTSQTRGVILCPSSNHTHRVARARVIQVPPRCLGRPGSREFWDTSMDSRPTRSSGIFHKASRIGRQPRVSPTVPRDLPGRSNWAARRADRTGCGRAPGGPCSEGPGRVEESRERVMRGRVVLAGVPICDSLS